MTTDQEVMPVERMTVAEILREYKKHRTESITETGPEAQGREHAFSLILQDCVQMLILPTKAAKKRYQTRTVQTYQAEQPGDRSVKERASDEVLLEAAVKIKRAIIE